MTRLLLFSSRHPWTATLLLLAVTLLASYQLPGLSVNISAQGLLVEDSSEARFYRHSQETFGSESITIAFVADPELFQAGRLRAVGETIKRIEALPFVAGTTSLFSIQNVRNDDGYISSKAYLAAIPDEAGALAEIRRQALLNPLVAGNLLSTDGTAMAINIELKPGDGEPGRDQALTRALEEAITPLRAEVAEVFQIGAPAIRAGLSERVVEDQRNVMPLAVLALVVTLALTLRQLSAAIIPLLTAGLSVVWTLGLMAWLGIPVGIMTSIVPALLVIIGSTEDIHLLAEYRTGMRKHGSPTEAIRHMASHMATPVLLTFVTTYLGFLSIHLNDLGLLKEFGLVASTGLMLNFLITALLLPLSLQLFARLGINGGGAGPGNLYPKLIHAVYRMATLNRRATVLGLVVLTGAGLYGASLLQVNNNPLDFLDQDSPVQQRAQAMHDRLAGIHTFAVVLDSRIEGTFLKTRYLQEVARLQDYLAEDGRYDKSLSFADFMALVNGIMEAEDGEFELALPDADNILQEYMLFLKHRDVAAFVSEDYASARIVVRHNIGSSRALSEAVEELEAFIGQEIDPALRVHVTGESILSQQAADAMAVGQAKSLVLMVVTILVVVAVLFTNLKAGLLAVVPNMLPIIGLFGVMGFLGLPLDTGTSMVAAIALGICVDDTMHFMTRYHQQIRGSGNESLALANTVKKEAVPIVSTSLALALGFLTLGSSSFIPVSNFGLLSAMVIVLALLATFLVTPMLLHSTSLITLWDLLTVEFSEEKLRKSPLFRDLARWEIRKVVLVGDVREFQTGQNIIHQGETGTEMFVVLEGGVNIQHREPDGSNTRLGELSAGALIGEVALVAQLPRTADVVANKHTRVLALDWQAMEGIGRLLPGISKKLFRNIAGIIGQRLASEKGAAAQLQDCDSGVYSRAFLEHQAQLELARTQRHQSSLGLLLVQLNGPKDDSGHNEPRLMHAAAVRLSEQVRDTDILARWDRDRFAILAFQADTENTDTLAGRLRACLEDLKELSTPPRIDLIPCSEAESFDSLCAHVDQHYPALEPTPVASA